MLEGVGNFPEHASWLVPAIDAALKSESDGHTRRLLTQSRARLISAGSGRAGRSVESGH